MEGTAVADTADLEASAVGNGGELIRSTKTPVVGHVEIGVHHVMCGTGVNDEW